MASNIKISTYRYVQRFSGWRLRRKSARHIRSFDAGRIKPQYFVETGFLDAHDPDGWGTRLYEPDNVLRHLGRLHVRVTPREFDRLAELLRGQEAHGQRSGIVETVAEAEHPTPVIILQALENELRRACSRPAEAQ